MNKSALLALTLSAALLLPSCGVLSPLLENHHNTQQALHDSDSSHESDYSDNAIEDSNHNSDHADDSNKTHDSDRHSEKHSSGSTQTAYVEDYDAAFSACLGDLDGLLNEEDYAALQALFDSLWELRSARVASGSGSMTVKETRAMEKFSLALDDYTEAYIGDYSSFFGEEYDGEEGEGSDVQGAVQQDEPEEVDLVDFAVESDGTLGEASYYEDWDDSGYTLQQAQAMWDTATALLPPDALTVFDTYTLFTDGADETLGYVYWDFIDGDVNNVTWCLALDPADGDDQDALEDTLLHEYFHYLSLNESQVDYEGEHTMDTYAEDDYEIYCHEDSYLNQFYEAFWPSILVDERLANSETEFFFLRHYNDFYDDYAITDPSEDICECFSAYVLFSDGWYDDDDLDVWEQKIAWFDQFEELKTFRQQVRSQLGYD
jgi:hypothetical protein